MNKRYLSLTFFILLSNFQFTDLKCLGGFSISVDLFEYILKVLPPGKTILELGSGAGTGNLAEHYVMYSIEHDKNWLNRYNTTYIYAPIKNYGRYPWYDADAIAKQLPKNYDLILVDGPPGTIGRYGFFEHLNLFKTEVIIIFDDVQRLAEANLLKDVAKKLRKRFEIHKCSDGKMFGVIKK